MIGSSPPSIMRQAALLLTLAAAAQAQFMERCSNYQTTGNFDHSYIETMRNQPGGWIVRLSTVVTDQCQRLQFIDGNDYNFTSIDMATQIQHNYTDRYTVSVATVTMPAKLTLTIQPRAHAVRVVGGDSSGSLTLYPLVARDDMIAFASCHVGIPFMMRERVLVMTPFHQGNLTSVAKMTRVLNAQGVPRVEELFETNNECMPNANATQPFDIFAIIASPFQRVAQIIPINANGENNVVNNAAGVAEQTLAFLRGQYPQYLNNQGGEAKPAASAPAPEAASENLDAFRLAAEKESASAPETSAEKASPEKASETKLSAAEPVKAKPVVDFVVKTAEVKPAAVEEPSKEEKQ